MRKSTVALPRAIARVRRPHVRRSIASTVRRPFRPGRLAGAALRPVGRRVGDRFGLESAAPAVVALILTVASVLSWLPGEPARGAVAGAIGGPGEAPVLTPIHAPVARLAPPAFAERARQRAADAPQGARPAATPTAPPPEFDLTRIDPDAVAAATASPTPPAPTVGGPFLADGTLVKPVAVDTTVPDGRHLIRIHRIARGESLATIADRYNISMMTIWWANNLRSHNLVVGKTLAIPPVDGLVIAVHDGDTLASLATKHDVVADAIRKVNELDDPVLVPGQVLILPGAAGAPVPEPTPPPASTGKAGAAAPGQPGQRPVHEPSRYAGGRMVWPVVGGNNHVSRGFAGGHQGLDIAGDHGSHVVAAAPGTVTFAGWKPNGGGYQIWVAHGSGIYTTYNHLSAVSVGTGQAVAAGQMIGRLGSSGHSTGPHLHFEVWKGPIWAGGKRVNPESSLQGRPAPH